MTRVPIEKKRVFALVGHGSSGKTSIAEAILYASGVITRLGRVQDGNTVSDYDPEEIKRKISINTTIIPFETEGYSFTMMDTPGYMDFVGEMIGALSATNCATVVVNAGAGVELQTISAWNYCDRFGLPRIVFINQMDKEGVDFTSQVEEIRTNLDSKTFPLVFPVTEGGSLKGAVDLFEQTYYETKDGKRERKEIPESSASTVDDLRAKMIESIVEADDDLLSRYLEGEEIGEESLKTALRNGIAERKLFPILAGSAIQNVGISELISFIRTYLPSPGDMPPQKGQGSGSREENRKPSYDAPFSARIFKTYSEPHIGELAYLRIWSGVVKSGDTIYNSSRETSEKITTMVVLKGKTREDRTEASAGEIVACVKLKDAGIHNTLCEKENLISYPKIEYPKSLSFEAVKAESKGDMEKIAATLNRMKDEDPTLLIEFDPDTRETIVRGMGELHLLVVASRVQARAGVSLEWSKPRVAYKETIRGNAKCQGRYKKQTGGRGQFGDVWLELNPRVEGEGFEFINKIFGGVVPSKYVPAVEKGVVEAMVGGVLAGYPIKDISVKLYDGSHHPVDSSDLAFKVAASMGFKKAFMEAKPVLMEPITKLSVTVPDKYLGEVMGDINSRRGKVLGIEADGSRKTVSAMIPIAELYKYINTLRSITQGQGVFTSEFSHYEEVPANISQEIIARYQREKAGEEE